MALTAAERAYKFGDAIGLWEVMDADQRGQFQRAVVTQSLYFARRFLRPYYMNLEPLHECIALAERWLESPSAALVDSAGALRATLDLQNEHAEHEDDRGVSVWPHHMADLLAKAIQWDTTNMRKCLWTGRYPAHIVADVIENRLGPSPGWSDGPSWAAKRWQVSAAWAILHGEALPALNGDAIEGAEGAYVEGVFARLAKYLDETQQAALKIALGRLALHYASRGLPPPEHDQGERACYEAAQRWFAAPSPENGKACFEVGRRRSRGFDRHRFRLPAWSAAASVAGITGHIQAGTWHIATHDISGVARSLVKREDDPNPVETGERAFDATTWWQLDTAWAIYRGEEVPSLEGT